MLLRASDVSSFIYNDLDVSNRLVDDTAAESIDMDGVFEDLQKLVDVKQLRPVLRTDFMRTVYRRTTDDTVSVLLDTGITISKEDSKMRAGRWHRPSYANSKVTQFPYAVLEIRLAYEARGRELSSSSSEGEEDSHRDVAPPAWMSNIISSGLLVEVGNFSKFTHGCAVLLHKYARDFPYWIQDDEIQASMPLDMVAPSPRRVDVDDEGEHLAEDAPLLGRSVTAGYGSVDRAKRTSRKGHMSIGTAEAVPLLRGTFPIGSAGHSIALFKVAGGD